MAVCMATAAISAAELSLKVAPKAAMAVRQADAMTTSRM
jgi:hypothetical protein